MKDYKEPDQSTPHISLLPRLYEEIQAVWRSEGVSSPGLKDRCQKLCGLSRNWKGILKAVDHS